MSTVRNSSIIKEVEDEQYDSIQNLSEAVPELSERVDASMNDQNFSSLTIPTQIIEHFVIVWLNLNDDQYAKNIDDSISKLQSMVGSIQTFTNIDESIDSLSDVTYKQAFFIYTGSNLEQLVGLIEDIPELSSVYVFDKPLMIQEQWLNKHKKVRGIFTRIDDLFITLRKEIYATVIDLTPISIIPAESTNLNELDQSFMYTQILKEVILETKYGPEARKEFINWLLEKGSTEKTIRNFDQNYENVSAITWYKKEWFIYSTLNAALRTQNVEGIMKIAFFLHDLHREIEKKYSEKPLSPRLTVYRGQALSNDDFEKLKKNPGGLLSFNNFLSTSLDQDASMLFAFSSFGRPNTTVVLFQMEMDLSVSDIPYVSLATAEKSGGEQEILFSMHTVFRIGEITYEQKDNIWRINLLLTNDNDPQLKALTDCLRTELGGNGWFKMATLLHKMGKFKNALEVYENLLRTTLHDDPMIQDAMKLTAKTSISDVHGSMGNYSDALEQLKQVESACQNLGSSHPVILCKCFFGMATIYYSIGNYRMALIHYHKALEIEQNHLSSDYLICVLNNNMGMTYQAIADYPAALVCFEKVRDYQERNMPCNHPDVARYHHNMGLAYYGMGKYSLALECFQKAWEIVQKALPGDHLDLMLFLNSLSMTYQAMGKLSMALSYAEKALEIQKDAPDTNPNLPVIYSAIALIHLTAENHALSLSFYKKTINFYEQNQLYDSSHLGKVYVNVATLHEASQDYLLALLYYKKARNILEKTLPVNHPDWITYYVNLGRLYRLMNAYSTALTTTKKALEIGEKHLHSNHPRLAYIHSALGTIYEVKGNFPIARSYYEKARNIFQNTLPLDHPDLHTVSARLAWTNKATTDIKPHQRTSEAKLEPLPIDQTHSISTYNDVRNTINTINNENTKLLQTLDSVEQLVRLDSSNAATTFLTSEEVADVNKLSADSHALLSNMEKMIENLLNSPGSSHPSSLGALTSANDRNLAAKYLLKAIQASQQMGQIVRESGGVMATNMPHESFNELQSIFYTNMDKVFQIIQSSNPSNPTLLPGAYNNMGVELLRWKQYSKALKYFQKAEDILVQASPTNHSMLAMIYDNIGKAFVGLERYSEAADYAERALVSIYKDFESTDELIQKYQNQFIICHVLSRIKSSRKQ